MGPGVVNIPTVTGWGQYLKDGLGARLLSSLRLFLSLSFGLWLNSSTGAYSGDYIRDYTVIRHLDCSSFGPLNLHDF